MDSERPSPFTEKPSIRTGAPTSGGARFIVTSFVSLILHTLYCGATRFGKSEACISRICPQMTKRDRASYFVFDPPGTMVRKIAQYLVMYGIPFYYDKLS